VGLADWLAALPLGLATDVGSRGARLSGGERQRVALARAQLSAFHVLVLDEPTEHVDAVAAEALTTALLSQRRARSTVLITHRLTGLEAVDQVLVLEDGAIVARGTHAELVARDGGYAALWREEQRLLSDLLAHKGGPGALEGRFVVSEVDGIEGSPAT
jgi:ATP-binding cassette, subfamily C, bacterial CydCD